MVCSESLSVLGTFVVFKMATIVVSRMGSVEGIVLATVIALFLGVNMPVVLLTGTFEG